MKSVSMALMLISGPVWADAELVSIYGGLLEKCYSGAETYAAKTACSGEMSDTCMATEEGGYTTLGMSYCMQSETEVWDRFLNQEYKLTMDWAAYLDAEDQEIFPSYAIRVKYLREAQRSWINYRDAECQWDYSIWGAGSLRHIAANSCFLEMTSQRAIELWSFRELDQ